MTQRPTTIRMFRSHCPWAVELYETGAECDRGIYAAGTAAHDVLDALMKLQGNREDIARAVVERLTTTGREGIDSEGPLPLDKCIEGRDLALAYVADNGLPTRAKSEVGLAFDKAWRRVEYGSQDAMFQTRLDVVEMVEIDDDESPGTGLCCSDWKTQWNAGAFMLESIQMRAQAVALSLCWDEFLPERPDFIRRRIINLRTGRPFDESEPGVKCDLWLDDPSDAHKLEEWRQDIEMVVSAIEKRPRIPSPGANCLGCTYAATCEPCSQAALSDASGIALRYVTAKAIYESTAKLIQKALNRTGVMPVHGGSVGYQTKEGNATVDGVESIVWDAWRAGQDYGAGADSAVRGLLSALGIGVTSVKSVAKKAYPDKELKESRAAFLDRALTTETKVAFGVAKGGGDVEQG